MAGSGGQSAGAVHPWFETFMEKQHGQVTEFIQKDQMFGLYTEASSEVAAYGAFADEW